MTKNTREDVVRAAGRLFAERGYHGTSMRDLGRELGLLGSSLYAHVDGKQELLVEVVERGAALFQASADAAGTVAGPGDRLRALMAGHIGVVLENRDEVRTFLHEAHALDDDHRMRIIAARDRYEQAFRDTLSAGVDDGSFRADLDPVIDGIFILSVLNALDRWYRDDGRLTHDEVVGRLDQFVMGGVA
jgi:AcrR family transcriptional regulator